jgi:hypothetical protein
MLFCREFSDRFNRSMTNYDRAEIAAQVDKMRADIQRCGESHVGCDELKLLCPETSAKEEKNGIEQIAEWERGLLNIYRTAACDLQISNQSKRERTTSCARKI